MKINERMKMKENKRRMKYIKQIKLIIIKILSIKLKYLYLIFRNMKRLNQ
jgi:hypothetical protein